MGITKLSLNKPKEALSWLMEAKLIANETKDKKMLTQINEQLSITQNKLGNPTKAGAGNKGKPKSEEHKRKISESLTAPMA